MKFHWYFFAKQVERSYLTPSMAEYVVLHYVHKEAQPAGRVRYWAKVKELDAYVRIVVLPDGETVLNGFIDHHFGR